MLWHRENDMIDCSGQCFSFGHGHPCQWKSTMKIPPECIVVQSVMHFCNHRNSTQAVAVDVNQRASIDDAHFGILMIHKLAGIPSDAKQPFRHLRRESDVANQMLDFWVVCSENHYFKIIFAHSKWFQKKLIKNQQSATPKCPGPFCLNDVITFDWLLFSSATMKGTILWFSSNFSQQLSTRSVFLSN